MFRVEPYEGRILNPNLAGRIGRETLYKILFLQGFNTCNDSSRAIFSQSFRNFLREQEESDRKEKMSASLSGRGQGVGLIRGRSNFGSTFFRVDQRSFSDG